MEQRLRENIRKFYLFNILSSFVLYYAIDKILMASRGLSVTDIVLVEIAYTVARVVLEVPSGALADRWSRKYVLAMNMALFTLTTFLWAIAPGLSMFVLGSLIASIHSALKSGTDTSFLYDTLKQLGKTDDYVKTQGNVMFWENLLSILAGIGGGMLADAFGLAVPFWVTLPFSLGAAAIALTFTEPQIHRTTGEISFWRHIAGTGRYLLKHQYIVHLTVFSVIMGISILLIDEYSQLYFVGIGVPILALGYLSAVGSGIEAIGGKVAYRLNRFGRKKVFALAIAVSAAGFVIVGLTNSLWGVPFAFLPWLAYYFTYPLALGDLHNELPSEQRATGESFLALSRSLAYAPAAFGFGRAADKFSISTAYLIIGAMAALYFVLFIFSFRGRQMVARETGNEL